MQVIDVLKGMEWPSIIIGAVIGAFIPVLFKWIISLFRTRKEKYHLSLCLKESASYKTMNDGDVAVDVRYKGEIYNDLLSIIEIGLVNDGLEDISYVNRFDKPILVQSCAYRIVDAQYIGDPVIKANISQAEDSVQIEWGLLKKDEMIVVRLVGEYLGGEEQRQERISFYDSLSFSVRSDCVDYITPRKVSFRYLAVMSFIASFLFGVIMYFSGAKTHSSAEVYTFKYGEQVVSGNLRYDEVTEYYTLSDPDSLVCQNKLLDFKRYPRIIVSRSWQYGTFVFVVCLGMWLSMLLISAVLVISDKKKDDQKHFK